MSRTIHNSMLLGSNQILRRTTIALNQIFVRTVVGKEVFSYETAPYRGKFEYQNQNLYPRRLAVTKEEELLDEIHAIKNKEITEPSPFHVVRRVKSMNRLDWTQKVTLRRLNLHSSINNECVIVPNTPSFNSMLAKVKHLLVLKPAVFANGKIPSAEDIGAIKVCPYTGLITVDEKVRASKSRTVTEKPILWQGNHLRAKINKLVGLRNNHFLK